LNNIDNNSDVKTELTIIGLTGGICSGKTTISNLFSDLGVEVIDTDIISHQLMAPQQNGFEQTVRHFGSKILLDSGEINRAKLKSIIFSNLEQKKWLEEMLHPLIKDQTKQQIIQANTRKTTSAKYILLVVPLLFETNFHRLCDKVLAIDCEPETQMERLIQRDSITKNLASKIIQSQLSNQNRLKRADYIIDNNRNSDPGNQVIEIDRLLS
jgi:dephospho-CoA kinase